MHHHLFQTIQLILMDTNVILNQFYNIYSMYILYTIHHQVSTYVFNFISISDHRSLCHIIYLKFCYAKCILYQYKFHSCTFISLWCFSNCYFTGYCLCTIYIFSDIVLELITFNNIWTTSKYVLQHLDIIVFILWSLDT
jgi:hypothetical protein